MLCRSQGRFSAECYLCGYFSIVDPAHSGKVGGLCTVEAMIEASVVAIREGDHELSSFLSDLVSTYDQKGERHRGTYWLVCFQKVGNEDGINGENGRKVSFFK